jgi:hypothetical protein
MAVRQSIRMMDAKIPVEIDDYAQAEFSVDSRNRF